MIGTATITADLLTEILLSAALSGQATIAGSLTIPGSELQGAMQGSAVVTGNLTTDILLQGAMSGSSALTGLLITDQMADIVGLITLSSRTPIITLH